MMSRHVIVKLALCAFFAGAIMVAGKAATPGYASGMCPADKNACVIVNSNQDNNVRDGVVTLREAMLLDTGGLAYSSLTFLEQLQVSGPGTDFAAEGIRGIYFNPVLFCEGCASNVIILQPPGFGGPSNASGDGPSTQMTSLDYTPPGFGGPASLPPGFGGPAGSGGGGQMSIGRGLLDDALMTPPGFGGPSTSIGLGLSGVEGETAARVTFDGSLLGDSTAGLRVANQAGWIRGVHFRNFRGTALQILDSLRDQTRVGSNSDGLLDAAESVTFASNGRDVEAVRVR